MAIPKGYELGVARLLREQAEALKRIKTFIDQQRGARLNELRQAQLNTQSLVLNPELQGIASNSNISISDLVSARAVSPIEGLIGRGAPEATLEDVAIFVLETRDFTQDALDSEGLTYTNLEQQILDNMIVSDLPTLTGDAGLNLVNNELRNVRTALDRLPFEITQQQQKEAVIRGYVNDPEMAALLPNDFVRALGGRAVAPELVLEAQEEGAGVRGQLVQNVAASEGALLLDNILSEARNIWIRLGQEGRSGELQFATQVHLRSLDVEEKVAGENTPFPAVPAFTRQQVQEAQAASLTKLTPKARAEQRLRALGINVSPEDKRLKDSMGSLLTQVQEAIAIQEAQMAENNASQEEINTASAAYVEQLVPDAAFVENQVRLRSLPQNIGEAIEFSRDILKNQFGVTKPTDQEITLGANALTGLQDFDTQRINDIFTPIAQASFNRQQAEIEQQIQVAAQREAVSEIQQAFPQPVVQPQLGRLAEQQAIRFTNAARSAAEESLRDAIRAGEAISPEGLNISRIIEQGRQNAVRFGVQPTDNPADAGFNARFGVLPPGPPGTGLFDPTVPLGGRTTRLDISPLAAPSQRRAVSRAIEAITEGQPEGFGTFVQSRIPGLVSQSARRTREANRASGIFRPRFNAETGGIDRVRIGTRRPTFPSRISPAQVIRQQGATLLSQFREQQLEEQRPRLLRRGGPARRRSPVLSILGR